MVEIADPLERIPETIKRIIPEADRELAWKFFVFFSRMEYALKRAAYFQPKGKDGVSADWHRFGAENHDAFFAFVGGRAVGDPLRVSVEYFSAKPPRKQVAKESRLEWSDPQLFAKDYGKKFSWLLLMVNSVRNNLFHGGKFIGAPATYTGSIRDGADTERDQNLLEYSYIILSHALTMDKKVERYFHDLE